MLQRYKILLSTGFLLLAGLALWGMAGPNQAELPTQTAFSAQGILKTSWQFYKQRFLVNGERVASNHYGGTISEGQSYALLKALWMNEPETFERIWSWTHRHMKRPQDALLGWRWGKRDDGSMGLLETENAADADQDIAYALLLAGEKWQRPDYIQAGQAMIQDLWRLNVIHVDGITYLLPGTWEGFRQEILTVDPSYFAPYVYQNFARYDQAHAAGWRKLAADQYETLEACSNLSQSGLPPNWCGILWEAPHNGTSRVVFSDKQGKGSRNFSYDAFRVFWRMTMDAALSPPEGAAKARAYLKNHPFLQTYWLEHRQLPEGFSPEGTALNDENSGFALASALAQAHVLNPGRDPQIYKDMLQPAYHPQGYWFNDSNDYLHSVIWLHVYATTLRP